MHCASKQIFDDDGYPISTDNYFISMVASLKGLTFDPKRHMPLPVGEISLGPLFHHEIDQSRRVVLHALNSHQTLDAYLERSRALAEMETEPYQQSDLFMYRGLTPIELQRKAFGRHVGLAISAENDQLDEILGGLRAAYIRGDEVMQQIDSAAMFQPAFCRLRRSVSHEDRPFQILNARGEVRSLGLLSLLMGKSLQFLTADAFVQENASVVQAIVLGQPDNSLFQKQLELSGVWPEVNRDLAKMDVQQVQCFRAAMGIPRIPERAEVLHRFRDMICSVGGFTALYEYAGSDAESFSSVILEVFRELGGSDNQERYRIIKQIVRGWDEMKSMPISLANLALASRFVPGSQGFDAVMHAPKDRLVECIEGASFTASECCSDEILLAVLLTQPVDMVRAWADDHDVDDRVVSALYELSKDVRYLEMVKSLEARGKLFVGDLGL